MVAEYLLFLLRQGSVAFSITDVQEMDSIISCFSAFETKEAGPLILTWAVFLCLISSLPEKDENNFLMVHIIRMSHQQIYCVFLEQYIFIAVSPVDLCQEIDHIGYVRQAFEVSSLSYFLEILESATLKDSDVSKISLDGCECI